MYGSVSNVVLVFASPFETCTTTVLVLYITKMKLVFISERNDVVSYQVCVHGWVCVCAWVGGCVRYKHQILGVFDKCTT